MTGLSAQVSPRALVPGDPEEVAWLAREYGRYAGGASSAAATLRRIDTGAWVGPAGDAFRAAIGEVPDKLERGCAAFERAASALGRYAQVLEQAQADAGAAVRRWSDGEDATSRWQAQVAAAEAAPGSEVPSGYDPGADDRAAAERLLTSAREHVRSEAARAARALADAEHGAPDEPGLLSKAVHAVGSFLAGAGEATWGLLELGFTTSPTYALLDPEGFLAHTRQLAEGVVAGVQHPGELAKALVDYDTWRTDPARALGHLVPDLLLTVATAGVGEAGVAGERLAVTAEHVAEAGERAALTESRLAAEFPEFVEEGLPSQAAREFQTGDLYPHQDPWRDRVAEVDEVFWVGEPFPGQFVVPDSELEHVGSSARRYYEGVQVGPKDLGSGPRYRDGGLAGYRVTRPFPLAEAVAEANTQFGAGGLRELFVPKPLTDLVDGGWISRVGHHPLPDDLDAVIPAEGLTAGRMAP